MSMVDSSSAREVEWIMASINSRCQGADSKKMQCQPYSLLLAATDVAGEIKDAAAICRVQVQDIDDVYPCTPLQAALMVSTLKSLGAYICKFKYPVLRTTEINRLWWAWDTLKPQSLS